MTLRHAVPETRAIGSQSARGFAGLLIGLLAQTSALQTSAEVNPHLLSAQRHAKGSAPLQQTLQKWSNEQPAGSEPASLGAPSLPLAEAQFRKARASGQPVLAQRLIERECLSYRMSLKDPDFKTPVWYLSHLKVMKIHHTRQGTLEVTAQASTLAGPIVNSRITFSAGLHQSCFGNTDAQGQVRCRLLDTHPHGEPEDAAHESTGGELLASLQGKVTPDVIEWPSSQAIQLKRH